MSVFPATKELRLKKHLSIQRMIEHSTATRQRSSVRLGLLHTWMDDDDDDDNNNNNNNKPHCSGNFYSTKYTITLVIYVSVN